MAVDNSSLWWSTWGIWWGVWLVTLLALAVAGGIVVKHWRREKKRAPHRQLLGISFYLHDKSVMNLYQLARYNEALEQQVEKRTSHGVNLGAAADFGRVKGTADRSDTTEEFRKYLQKAEPITVIGIIMEVLEARDDIVYVDLVKRELTQNKALTEALGWADDPETTRQRLAKLRGLDAFVSFKGLFRKVSQTDEHTVFLAPYGDPDDPALGPRVRFTCVTSGMRDDAHDGTFQARCLGRVEDWDPHTGQLVVHPIAIFK